MTAAYEALRRRETLPATYEIVYGASWGASGTTHPAAQAGEVHIAPGAIRHREAQGR
jgi:hypothetical protein